MRIACPAHFLAQAAALICAACLPVRAQAPPALGSAVWDWDALVPQPTRLGCVRRVYDGPAETFSRLEMHVTTLNPGNESHLPHHHSQEEMILIKEGTVEFSVNGRRERAGAGSLLFAASHDVHNLANIGERPATYYVINFCTAATDRVPDRPATGARRQLVDSPTFTMRSLG